MNYDELKAALMNNQGCISMYASMALMPYPNSQPNLQKFSRIAELATDPVDLSLDDAEAFKQGIKHWKEQFDSHFIEYWDNL